MRSITWLGLDTAVRQFGFAAMRAPVVDGKLGAVELLTAGTWETRPDEEVGKFADTARRIGEISAEMLELLFRTRPDVVFVEGLAFVRGVGFLSASQMGRVRGVLEGICAAKGIPLLEFSSQRVKNFTLGERIKGREESKAAVAAKVRELYAVAEGLDENATDAVAVAHCGLHSPKLLELAMGGTNE